MGFTLGCRCNCDRWVAWADANFQEFRGEFIRICGGNFGLVRTQSEITVTLLDDYAAPGTVRPFVRSMCTAIPPRHILQLYLHRWYPKQPQPASERKAEKGGLYILASREMDADERVGTYHRAQKVAPENVPVIYTARPERLTAGRNGLGNATPTGHGIRETRHLYRTGR